MATLSVPASFDAPGIAPLSVPKSDLKVAERFLGYLFTPRGSVISPVIELRVWKARFDWKTGRIVPHNFGVLAGWYTNPHDMLVDLRKIEGVSPYVIYNPASHDLLGRSMNMLRKVEDTTKDENILEWWNIYLDIDTKRATDISSTNEELESARPVLASIFHDHPLVERASIHGCSGNGLFAAIAIEPLPVEEAKPLVAHFIAWIAAHYSTKSIEIDVKTKNASRVGCIPGLPKCKGHNISERPWRLATLDSPDRSLELLDLPAWVAEHPLPAVAQTTSQGHSRKGRSKGQNSSSAAGLTELVTNHENPCLHDDRIARATLYLASIPGAISGASADDSKNALHGHNHTYNTVCAIVQGFDLTLDQARPLLLEWNKTCVPPWSEQELDHKIRDAIDKPGDKPRGYKYREKIEENGHTKIIIGGPTPEVMITPFEMSVNDQVCENLYRQSDLYQRNYSLSEVVYEDNENNSGGIFVPKGTPLIVRVGTPRLREIISEVVKFKKKSEESPKPFHAHPPDWCVSAVHSRGMWPGLPRLTGVIEHPVLRPDGSSIESPGYDRATGLLWLGEDFEQPTLNPTIDDVKKSVDTLFGLIDEFEFEDGSSKAVWLACLLTILNRHLINDAVPLFYFDANTSGSGKTLLCDVLGLIATGREMVRTSYYHDPIEMDKRFVSIALNGIRVTMLDNIQGEFGNSSLDNALTARYYSGRILGKSEMSPPLLLDTVFVATANNAVLCGDLHRRIAQSRLVSSCEQPDKDRTNFKIIDLKDYAVRNRPELLRCAMTIMRGYILAGCPHAFPTNVYGSWSKLIRGAVFWAAGLDPWGNRDAIIHSDLKRTGYAAFVEGFSIMLDDLNLVSMTAGEILKALETSLAQSKYAMVWEAILDLWGDHSGRMPGSRLLGKRMAGLNMTRFGDRRLVKVDFRNKSGQWSVHQFINGHWIPRRSG